MKKQKETSVLPEIIKKNKKSFSSGNLSDQSSSHTSVLSTSGYMTRTSEENNSILVKIMTSEIFKVKCRHCLTILQSENQYEHKKCKCGKIGIDGGRSIHNRRLTGSLNDVDYV